MSLDTSEGIGYDPLYTQYGAPVLLDRTGNSSPSLNLLSAYSPIVFDVSYAGDAIDIISKQRVHAELFYGSTPVSLGTQVKTNIDVSGTLTYRFNFAEMLKTVFNSEFYNNISSDQINTGNENIVVPFYIVFTPYFESAGGWTREDISLTSLTFYATNAILPDDNSNRQFNYYQNRTLDDSASKFLTFAPTTKTLYVNETEQLSFFYLRPARTVELNYTTYNAIGGIVSSGTKSLVNCYTSKYGTLTISADGASSLLFGYSNLAKLEIYLKDDLGAVISETRTYNLSQSCSDGYRLAWQNSFGAVDKWTFTAHKNRTTNVGDRVIYNTPLGNEATLSERSSKVLKTTGQTTYTATSHFLANELEMFEDLLYSVEVYWEKELNLMIPIIIISTTQTLEDNDGLIQVTVEFVLSQTKQTHIG